MLSDTSWLSSLLSFFLAGVLGGAHCFGMCGGIVGALGGLSGSQQRGSAAGGTSPFFLQIFYHAGRLSSYTLAGALAGGVGATLLLTGSIGVRIALLAIAGLMLFGMGLYLMGLPQFLLPLEKLGASFWKKLHPLSRPFIPVRNFYQAYPLGVVWGWLPCGLVYSALGSAIASGSSLHGASIMLAFGLGTLPNMLLAGLFAAEVRGFLQHRFVRTLAGALVASFGIYALFGVFRLLGMFSK